MSAGLAASTVTPGNTAPVASLTTPAIAADVDDCASAVDGILKPTTSNTPHIKRLMLSPTVGTRNVRGPKLRSVCFVARGSAERGPARHEQTEATHAQSRPTPLPATPLSRRDGR